jgi:hypothetical protein
MTPEVIRNLSFGKWLGIRDVDISYTLLLSLAGTPYCMAPEVIKNLSYGKGFGYHMSDTSLLSVAGTLCWMAHEVIMNLT